MRLARPIDRLRTPRRVLALLGLSLVLCACGGGSSGAAPPAGLPDRVESAYEVETPYVGDPASFWARDDIYVMSPDIEPLALWPAEVLAPASHGVQIIVLLPGDYRGRSNGSAPDGWLYIPESGTAADPLLVTYASAVGADILADPHPAERLGESQAQLTAVRVIGDAYQVFHGLTFADGFTACLLHGASHCVFDRCLWHETGAQPLRVRFDSQDNLIQRCVMRRFDPSLWGTGDTVAIQLSDGVCTNNHIVSNVILNYTDSYQHTDRAGDPYGLGAGTVLDNNFMGFTQEAYLQEPEGELLCGENSLDFKMGGTEAEPVMVTNNVFFGARATKAGCAASGSGGYAVTLQRLGTWIRMSNNVFIDNDSALFLNTMFLNVDPALGRIDPDWTFTGNVFSGIRSYATSFPSRTGRVMSGLSPALFSDNSIIDTQRLMDVEPAAGPWELAILGNSFYGPVELTPRDQDQLEADGNLFRPANLGVPTTIPIPWHDRTLEYVAPPGP